MLITIEEKDNKITINLSSDITWESALLMLVSAIHHLAKTTIDKATKATIAQLPSKPSKKDAVRIAKDYTEDVADQINFAISNVLNDICPKDPSLALSEVAIATLENEIIDYAYNNKITLKEALTHYEQGLAHSSVYPKNET